MPTTEDGQFIPCDNDVLLAQIGWRNVLSISGGRVECRETGVTLPVSNGYRVTVDLAAGDTYTVRRVFVRGRSVRVKGEEPGVYYEQVGDSAYRASRFRNVSFGEVPDPEIFTVVGVRAAFWAEQCNAEPETVIRESLTLAAAEDLARYLSRDGFDAGAVDFWPAVGGHIEVRAADGTLAAAYLDGGRFTPERWAERQRRSKHHASRPDSKQGSERQ